MDLSETPESIVQRQLDAYNRHDLESFLSTYSREVQILKFPGSEVILSGLAELRRSYAERFRQGSTIHAELVSRTVQRNFVIDKERVSGLAANTIVEAIAIYEVSGNLITRVWFIKD